MSIHDGTTNGPTGSSDLGPFPNLRQRRRRGLRLTTAAAVALGLAVGGGAVANASGSGSSTSTTTPGAPSWHGFGGTPPAAFGTVATVGANTFTLTTHDGTKVTVDVSSTTTYVDGAVTSPSLADVKVGAHVAVFGTDTSNTVAATKVAIGGPGGMAGHDGHGFGGTPPAAFGTVATVGTNTFTLTTHDGLKVTVDVNSSTTYVDSAVTSPSLADVKVGAHVAVFGTDTSNTVAATKVAIGGSGGPGGPGGMGGTGGPGGMGGHDGHGFGGTPPAAFGTVATVGANTFTLTTHDGTKVTVDVNSSTTYMEFGVTAPTVADVKVGTQVVVFGTDTSNTVAATKVGIGGPHGTDGGAGGSGDGDGHGPMGGMPAPGTGQASTNSTNSGSGSSVMA